MSKKGKVSEVVGQRTSDEATGPLMDGPELPAYGIHPAEGGGFLSYRLTSHGGLEILSPTRAGIHKGEQKHSALARMQKAMVLEFLGGRRR